MTVAGGAASGPCGPVYGVDREAGEAPCNRGIPWTATRGAGFYPVAETGGKVGPCA